MGMQPALLRFFSHAIATKNRVELQSLSSIAQLLLGGLGLIGGTGFLCIFPWFISLYEVPEAIRNDLFILFLAIAFDFLSNLFLIPFTTIVQGSNRFDIGNIRLCFAKILRIVVLVVGYSCFTPSLLILAASTFAGTLYQLISLVLIAYKIHGNSVFFHWKSLRWNLLLSLFSFSALTLIYQVSLSLSMQLPLLIIGKTLAVDMASAFYPAIVLSSVCSTVLMRTSAPLVPIATKDRIENGGKNLGRWAIQIGVVVACLGYSVVVVFALLGSEIMTVWLKEDFAWTGTVVMVTLLGVVFSEIQATNYRLALGGNFSIVPTVISSVAICVVASLGTFLGTVYNGWSLFDVAVFITMTRIISSFLLSISFSRQIGYRFMDYTWHVNVKPLLSGLFVIGLFYMLKLQFPFSLIYIPTLVLTSLLVICIDWYLCWKFVLHEKTKNSMRILIANKLFARSDGM